MLRFYPFAPLQLGDYLWRSVEGAAHPTAVARSPHGQEPRVEVGDAYGIRVTINGQDCGTYANSAEVPTIGCYGNGWPASARRSRAH